jgi:hypothetical protein
MNATPAERFKTVMARSILSPVDCPDNHERLDGLDDGRGRSAREGWRCNAHLGLCSDHRPYP